MAYNRRKLFAAVNRHLSADPGIHLGRLAGDLRVERHTIENLVREMKGKPFRKYQREKLLKKALELLAHEPNRIIKQIAVALGYESMGSFS